MEYLNSLLSIDPNYIAMGLLVVFYSLEFLLTKEFPFKNRPLHFFQNALFQIVFLLGNILFAYLIVFVITWFTNNKIGLLYLFDIPYWVKLVLAVPLFDLTTYWFHRAAHKIPLVWRFHRVHHSDTTLDSSSYMRGHPVEIFFWFGVGNMVACGLFGLDLVGLGLYVIVSTPMVLIEHTNLKFPRWWDKTFGLFITTPNMHKIHHDQDQYYTDSNFADIFILWDKLFGTFKYKSPELIQFGLTEFDEKKKQTFWYLLRSPFMKIERVQSTILPKEQSK